MLIYYVDKFCAEFNPCNSSPCQNGGTCNRSGRRGYYCTCVNHVIGNVCQTSKIVFKLPMTSRQAL